MEGSSVMSTMCSTIHYPSRELLNKKCAQQAHFFVPMPPKRPPMFPMSDSLVAALEDILLTLRGLDDNDWTTPINAIVKMLKNHPSNVLFIDSLCFHLAIPVRKTLQARVEFFLAGMAASNVEPEELFSKVKDGCHCTQGTICRIQ